MNRMFFGDARDLFKFDLVRHIMKAFPDLLSFTFVPMLTEEESPTGKKKTATKDLGLAQKKGRAGSKNRELMEDLGRLQEIDDDLGYFHGVRSYWVGAALQGFPAGRQRGCSVHGGQPVWAE